MCELLALSSSLPARLNFSLHTLASHGRDGGTTQDGWGVAFYQGDDVALFREPTAAGDSALVRFLESKGPTTDLAISHIRHATRGSLILANTQPFTQSVYCIGQTHHLEQCEIVVKTCHPTRPKCLQYAPHIMGEQLSHTVPV